MLFSCQDTYRCLSNPNYDFGILTLRSVIWINICGFNRAQSFILKENFHPLGKFQLSTLRSSPRVSTRHIINELLKYFLKICRGRESFNVQGQGQPSAALWRSSKIFGKEEEQCSQDRWTRRKVNDYFNIFGLLNKVKRNLKF